MSQTGRLCLVQGKFEMQVQVPGVREAGLPVYLEMRRGLFPWSGLIVCRRLLAQWMVGVVDGELVATAQGTSSSSSWMVGNAGTSVGEASLINRGLTNAYPG